MPAAAPTDRQLSPTTHTLASRKRVLKHLREKNAEAAVKDMTAALRKLRQGYLVMARGLKPGEPVRPARR